MSSNTISLIPATVNFDLYEGDTFIQPLEVLDGSTPYDFTGCTFEMPIRNNRTGEIVVSLVSEITSPEAGSVLIEVPAVTMALLPTGCKLVYDLKFTTGAGVVRTLLKGGITVEADIVSS